MEISELALTNSDEHRNYDTKSERVHDVIDMKTFAVSNANHGVDFETEGARLRGVMDIIKAFNKA